MIFSQYKGIKDIIKRYWRYYGGWPSFFLSPYLLIALLINIIMYSIWTKVGWWDTVIAILPNILGFSLGGYAIWLAVGDEKFKIMLSNSRKEDNSDSVFMKVNASFVHFIFFQIFALCIALIAKSEPLTNLPLLVKSWFTTNFLKMIIIEKYLTYTAWFFGHFVFLYALLSALAATLAVFRVASWYDHYQKLQNQTNQNRIEIYLPAEIITKPNQIYQN